MKILLAQNEDMATSFSTSPMDTRYLDGFCATIAVTGSPVGQFIVEGTVDQVTWVELTQTSANMLVTGTPINFKLNFMQIQDSYIRITWLASGGDGNTTIWIAGKALSGMGRIAQ
jgi:hypothetical protein